MYSGGFYSFPSQEEFWAYWSRYIFINRYRNAPKSVHEVLLELMRDKDYFVITTNVDHCFQKAGFDKKHLFYTQGDYGLFQCSEPCCQETFDNEKTVRAMVEAQGFTVADGVLTPPTDGTPTMAVPSELLPGCPHCGRPMTMNLRCDDKFAEDEGWHAAAERYENFLRTRDGNPKATYACINMGQASTLREIEERSILIDGDITAVIEEMKKTASYK